MSEAGAITLLPPAAQRVLVEQLQAVDGVAGDFAELGVYRGGSAQLMAEAGPDRTVYLFDTFSGAPYRDEFHKPGDFTDTSLGCVLGIMRDYPNVRVCAGLFPDSAMSVTARFAFVHLDADLYLSTLDGLQWFFPRMEIGGIILIDDYGRDTCPGVERAVGEFYGEVEVVGDGQARIIKT